MFFRFHCCGGVDTKKKGKPTKEKPAKETVNLQTFQHEEAGRSNSWADEGEDEYSVVSRPPPKRSDAPRVDRPSVPSGTDDHRSSATTAPSTSSAPGERTGDAEAGREAYLRRDDGRRRDEPPSYGDRREGDFDRRRDDGGRYGPPPPRRYGMGERRGDYGRGGGGDYERRRGGYGDRRREFGSEGGGFGGRPRRDDRFGDEESADTIDIEALELPESPPFCVRVGHLDLDTTEEDVMQFFGEEVIEVRFPASGRTSCFVEFKTLEGMKSGLMKNRKPLLSNTVFVDVARPRRELPPRHDGGFPRGEAPTSSDLPSDVPRPKLELVPRTAPLKEGPDAAQADEYNVKAKVNPFGAAKPVDLTKKLEEKEKQEEEHRRQLDAKTAALRQSSYPSGRGDRPRGRSDYPPSRRPDGASPSHTEGPGRRAGGDGGAVRSPKSSSAPRDGPSVAPPAKEEDSSAHNRFDDLAEESPETAEK